MSEKKKPKKQPPALDTGRIYSYLRCRLEHVITKCPGAMEQARDLWIGMPWREREEAENLIGKMKKPVCGKDHKIVKRSDSAVCDVCGRGFGWWCHKSPTNTCKYDVENDPCRDFCLHCGGPEERK